MKYAQGLCLIMVGASLLCHLAGWSQPIEMVGVILEAIVALFALAIFTALPIGLCVLGFMMAFGKLEKGTK